MPLDSTAPLDETVLSLAPRLYRCRQCGRVVARHDWLLPMGGDHEHVVFNPAGMVFRLWCFADALGLRPVGVPSVAFTWFRGYAWSVALCGDCGTHLGWRYDGSAQPSRFYGLIKDRLTEGPAE